MIGAFLTISYLSQYSKVRIMNELLCKVETRRCKEKQQFLWGDFEGTYNGGGMLKKVGGGICIRWGNSFFVGGFFLVEEKWKSAKMASKVQKIQPASNTLQTIQSNFNCATLRCLIHHAYQFSILGPPVYRFCQISVLAPVKYLNVYFQ